MGTVGDKYILKTFAWADTDVALSNPIINVYAYEATSGVVSSNDLIAAWVNTIWPLLSQVVTAGIRIKQIDAYDLDLSTDFDTGVHDLNGGVSDEYLPLFVGWEFEYLRATRVVHNGRKTFAGIPEGAQVDGVVVSSTYPARLAALASGLGFTITASPSVGVYTPKIYRRAGNYGSPPVAFPDTFYDVSGVSYRRISSQNSRKR